jgi:hypothetical protein
VKIRLQVWARWSWDNEWADIKVNGETIWKKSYQVNSDGWVNQCDAPNGWRDYSEFVEFIVPSTDEFLTISIYSNVDEDTNSNEALCFNQLTVQASPCANGCHFCSGPAANQCLMKVYDSVDGASPLWDPKTVAVSCDSGSEKGFLYQCLPGPKTTIKQTIPIDAAHYSLKFSMVMLPYLSWDSETATVAIDGK